MKLLKKKKEYPKNIVEKAQKLKDIFNGD